MNRRMIAYRFFSSPVVTGEVSSRVLRGSLRSLLSLTSGETEGAHSRTSTANRLPLVGRPKFASENREQFRVGGLHLPQPSKRQRAIALP